MSDSAVATPQRGERIVASTRPARRGRSAPGSAGGRQVRRRQPLPTGRAVVGGFLVAVSAVGIFAAWSSAAGGPDERFAVARRDLPIGHRIEAGDVTLQPMDLPTSLARAAFSNPRLLVGSTVVGPVGRGELLQAGDVVDSDGAPTDLEVSFAVERSRAVGGSLRPGEFVDVLGTFGAGGDTYTTTVVVGARVLAVDDGDGGLAAGDERTITLAVRTADEARAVTHAVNAGDVTLVRSRAAAGEDVDRSGTYRAPTASAASTDEGSGA